MPGYRFCGPGTKLEERLARSDRGINELDEACREHDIAYSKYKDNEPRGIADRVLAGKAWERVKEMCIRDRPYPIHNINKVNVLEIRCNAVQGLSLIHI